ANRPHDPPRRRLCYNAEEIPEARPARNGMLGPRTFTFLGTGTSVGIPMLGCDSAVCHSTNPRNHRYRCAVLISPPRGNILIYTPPEWRLKLLRAKVRLVHAVLFTHYHADPLFGMDDLRPFPHRLGGPMPLYCSAETEVKIRETFSYAFPQQSDSPAYSY